MEPHIVLECRAGLAVKSGEKFLGYQVTKNLSYQIVSYSSQIMYYVDTDILEVLCWAHATERRSYLELKLQTDQISPQHQNLRRTKSTAAKDDFTLCRSIKCLILGRTRLEEHPIRFQFTVIAFPDVQTRNNSVCADFKFCFPIQSNFFG